MKSFTSFGIVRPALACVVLMGSLVAQAAEDGSAKAREVERLISSTRGGPALWFGLDPLVNRGIGDSAWKASSGATFSVRGEDPWGRVGGAFGLPAEAKGGVMVVGSKVQSPINATEGAILMFYRPSPNAVPPMMLFSKSDWGQPGFFCLRINQVGTRRQLNLAVNSLANLEKAVQINFADVELGAWGFVAVSWREMAGVCTLQYWAGPLSSGELTSGGRELPPMPAVNESLRLGGRPQDMIEKFKMVPLTFAGGLLCQVAVFDQSLPDEAVRKIYSAARMP